MIRLAFNTTQTEQERNRIKETLYSSIKTAFTLNKDFVVEIKTDKTLKQLKGFFRICDILAPYFEEVEGIFFDKEMVKEYVKQECNYCQLIKGKVITKSLTNATKEEMAALIKKLYELGEFFNAKDYKLTSEEKQALQDYYK